jgi:uncharacterized protein YecT (DUF1311 family)
MRIALAVLAALSLGWSPLHAQRPWLRRCAGIAAQQPANVCYAAVAESLSARLDTLLGELHRALPGSRDSLLRIAQENWHQYLIRQCQFEYGTAQGGTLAPMLEAGCEADLTAARIYELKAHLCEGEGLTGYCEKSRRYDPH